MKFKDVAPIIVFACFITLFAFALNHPKPSLPKATAKINFSTTPLHSIYTGNLITLPREGVYIVNIFSSWCKSCRLENEQLLEFARSMPGIPIYGLLWMDSVDNGKYFLRAKGNPYKDVAIINDATAINFGATGIPEIFIVGSNNKLTYHIRGEISAKRLSYAIQQSLRENGSS